METAAEVHSVSEVHLHLINLCLRVCDLRDVVGGREEPCQSLHQRTRMCVSVERLSLYTLKQTVSYMYCTSQRELLISVRCTPKRGSKSAYAFFYVVCMALLV